MTKTINPRDRVLNWSPAPDPKNFEYPARRLIMGAVVPVRKTWVAGSVLDQGKEGACVGFGWTAELLARPFGDNATPEVGNHFALDLFHRAQDLDDWPGHNYSGTSVLAGAKAVVETGYDTSYWWAQNISDLRDSIIALGPVVIGIPWFDNMYEAPNGIVTIGGKNVGGHCLCLTGFDPNFRGMGAYYRWRNSWGLSYGVGGNAWIAENDLISLFSDGFEACVPAGRVKVTI